MSTNLFVGDASAGWTLAQATLPGAPKSAEAAAPAGGVTGGPAAPTGGAGPGGGFPDMFLILLVIMVVMIVFTSFAGRKQKKQREMLLSGVKRGDRVVTTAGVIGTVAELYDTEMVLRVDEASNTRIRFQRSALSNILREGKDGAAGAVEGKPKGEPVGAGN